MSDKDSLTDTKWPFSPSPQEDRSLNSLHSNTSTPRHNPYNQTVTQASAPLTTQQLYNKTNKAMQPSIVRWLTHATQQPPNMAIINLSHLPTTKLRRKRQPQKTIQPPLHELLDNEHWGDVPTTNPVYFHVISKNVNSLSTVEHNLQWRGAAHAMTEMDAHVLCVQEPNLKWTSKGLRQPIYRIFQKAFMHAKLSTSNSIDIKQGNYQPGGTFLTTLGCYAAREITMGVDSTGLGWWTYHELIGQRNHQYLIITAY